MVFDELTAEEFEKFALSQSNDSFAQSAEFAYHRGRDGARTTFLGVRSDNKVILGGLVSWNTHSLSGADFYCGPVGDFSDEKIVRTFAQGLKRWAGKQKISHITFNPTSVIRTLDTNGTVLDENLTTEGALKMTGFKRTGVRVTPHFVYVKNLARFGTENELFKSFSSSMKAMINGAEKNFITFKKLTRKELPRLEKLMEDSAERQGFKSRGVYFQESLFDSFADSPNFDVDFLMAEVDIKKLKKSYGARVKDLEDQIKKAETKGMKNELKNQLNAVVVRQGLLANEANTKIDVAAGIFVKSQRETVYLFAGNDPKYMKFNAIYLMIWREMQEAFKNKVPLFNFYGIEGKFDGSDGILGYKKGFNGIVQEYPGQWILVVNPLRYNSIRVVRKLRR